MTLWVKLCGMRTPSDLEAAVAAGADAVGFVLTPSPRQVTVAEAATLAARLPAGVRAVAVFHRPHRGLLAETERVLAPDLYQAEPDTLPGVDPDRVLPVVVDGPHLATRVEEALAGHPQRLVLVDGAARGGTGRSSDWGRLTALDKRHRVVVAGGLHPGNVAEAVRRVDPFGVDVSSGIERRPGEKDPELMIRFVAAARAAAEEGEVVR